MTSIFAGTYSYLLGPSVFGNVLFHLFVKIIQPEALMKSEETNTRNRRFSSYWFLYMPRYVTDDLYKTCKGILPSIKHLNTLTDVWQILQSTLYWLLEVLFESSPLTPYIPWSSSTFTIPIIPRLPWCSKIVKEYLSKEESKI